MDKKIEKITQIFDQFSREETGNRLSQFAMVALKDIVLSEIKRPEVPEVEVPEVKVDEKEVKVDKKKE